MRALPCTELVLTPALMHGAPAPPFNPVPFLGFSTFIQAPSLGIPLYPTAIQTQGNVREKVPEVLNAIAADRFYGSGENWIFPKNSSPIAEVQEFSFWEPQQQAH